MTFHQIEYFLAVAKFLNFSVAADDMFISQSTLSSQIKKLEEELGISLFVRSARSMRLTPAGEDFLVYAKRISNDISQSREKMLEYTSYKTGHIRIGLTPMMAYLGVPELISDFLKQYSNIEAHYYSKNSDSLLRSMREKKLMLAFVTAPFAHEYWSSIKFWPFLSEQLVLLVSKEHPAASQQQADLTQLNKEKLILPDCDDQIVSSIYSQFGINLNIVFRSDDVATTARLVDNNMGMALLGEQVAAKIAGPNSVIVPLQQEQELQHGLAMPKQGHLPLSTKALWEYLLKVRIHESELA